MGHRMFVAALPPEEVLEDLDAFLEPRRDAAGDGFRWTLPEQWHLTLAFLPEVPDRCLDDLVDNLARVADRHRAMDAAVAGGGAFPDPSRARVLWAGLDVADPAALDRLAANCRTAATTAGVEVPAERFRPHLTLVRSRHPFEATRWLRVLDAYRSATYRLDRVVLIRSHLGEGPGRRPRHEIEAEFWLRGGSESAPAPR